MAHAPARLTGSRFAAIGSPWTSLERSAEAQAARYGGQRTSVGSLRAAALGPRETLVICGTSVDPAVKERIQTAAPGSAVRKIPASILTQYRLNYRERRQRELARIEESEGVPA